MSIVFILLFVTSQSWREIHASPEELKARVELDDLWVNYKKTYNKTFTGDTEETQRRLIWERNLDYIQKHNREADLGLHTFTLGLSQFTDMTVDEYTALMLTYRYSRAGRDSEALVSEDSVSDFTNVPDTVNWQSRGYVTGVKNQGQCGSCWSFAATGALEGQWFNKTRRLVSLSEQNLIDCSRRYGNMGCDGGRPDYAFKYIKDNKGIDTEASYRYVGQVGNCRFQRATVGASCVGYKAVLPKTELALKRVVGLVGPVAVAIDAGQESFQHYQSGVYNDPNCGTELNHAVLVVGYGTYGGRDYWLVKNSWGTSWGDRGYIKMSRNLSNQCGIANDGAYPVV